MPLDPAPRTGRLLRAAGVVAVAAVRGLLLPRSAVRTRRRLQVCTAARVLSALGARVRVVQPAVPWPRTGGRLLTAHDAGWLGDLAVLTAVPRSTGGWAAVADRSLPFRGGGARDDDGDLLCSVTVTCRTADGPLARLPRRLGSIAALRDLVVEVWLLAPVRSVEPRTGEPRDLVGAGILARPERDVTRRSTDAGGELAA
ncbi:hypothetical protein [Blastococcus sp. TF02A-30]|uniref:hypothetical protein n=1 Tax=Blastococcus sp. TF02A-30 TaxID=2250580 RepID=UPI000DEA4001|nr:hypothetical protein [Blastococcus sp. TF02A-30]RBY84462.1 hypothetical protein DQ241_17390 [Blastococcus sp. TF02A-30]